MEQIYMLFSTEQVLSSILSCLYTKDAIQLSKTNKLFHSLINQTQIHKTILNGCLNYKCRPAFWYSMLPIQKAVDKVKTRFHIEEYDHHITFQFVKKQSEMLDQHIKDDIRKDTSRTFEIGFVGTEHGQKIFISLLECLVYLDEAVGYCQGMNFVVGILLNVYGDEEQAFWACLGLFKKCKLYELYKTGLPGLHIMNYQLQRLLESMLPRLYKHLRGINMSIDYFTSKWIMTLFGCFLSFELLLPAIDNLIIDGWLGFCKIALGLFKILEPKLCTLDVVDISTYVKGISREPIFDVSVFFQSIKSVYIDNNVLEILEKEYAIKEKELTKNIILFNDSQELNRKSIVISKEAQHFKILISQLERDMTDKTKIMANAQIQYEECKGEHDLLNDKLLLLKITLLDLITKYKKIKNKLTLKRSKKKSRDSLKETINFINKQIDGLEQNVICLRDEYLSKKQNLEDIVSAYNELIERRDLAYEQYKYLLK